MTHGETDLAALLRTMEPQLHPQPFVFCSVDQATYERLRVVPLGLFREAEGITLILGQQPADEIGLAYEQTWACITLTVHSALTAVGFLAAITARLAAARLSVNHLFVPWAERTRALELLRAFSR
jgi:uncharacterized protein